MGWDAKILWFVIIVGIASVIIFGLVKLGEVIVRRRTNALLAAHTETQNDASERDEESS